MSIIRLSNVTKRFGGEPILQSIDFRVEEGEKIGLIGRNGTGKSTLFRLIMGEMSPDEGEIERMKKARFACLAQLPEIRPHETLFDMVMRTFHELVEMEHRLQVMEERIASGEEELLKPYSILQEEFDHRGGYDFRHRAGRVLNGLGFHRDEFGLPVSVLSGGQRTRLMLALVLLEDADLLLLDEPENHLDIQAREWLENFLKDNRRAFVIISHDRQTLNTVVQRTVEVERTRLNGYSGNYDAYIANKLLQREQQRQAFERQQRFIEKEEAWIDRFRYKNTKARQAQSRMKRLEKVERIDAPDSEQSAARFRLGEVVRSGAVVLDAKDLGVSYGGLTLYKDVSFKVERGERLGIIGPNGSGKTTLLRQLAGKLQAPAGCITGAATLGHKVSLGFYDQHHESLNRGSDIFTEIRESRPDMTPEQVRSFMGRFLFAGEDVFKPIATLSGGELGRVAIAKLILSGANLLLLDEPTNHLDIATREILETALDEYDGTLLIVSHDRALIDRLAERLIIVSHTGVTYHLGNYADYKLGLEGRPPADGGPASDDVMKIRLAKAPKKKSEGREAAIQQRRRQRELEDTERDIANLEELVAEMEERFGAIDPSDFETARKMKEEYDGMKADLQALYASWEELADTV